MKIIAGVLAFLSLSAINGRTIDNQMEAIRTLCAWFMHWRQDSAAGTWWPQWLTRDDLRVGHAKQPEPGRPSWCYGTPGIARALQLAAIATGSLTLQRIAEHALADSLASPQIARLTNPGLCHGIAGLYQTAVRAESDSVTAAITSRLPLVVAVLQQVAGSPVEPDALINGNVGVRLAIETANRSALPISGWDACLLLT